MMTAAPAQPRDAPVLAEPRELPRAPPAPLLTNNRRGGRAGVGSRTSPGQEDDEDQEDVYNATPPPRRPGRSNGATASAPSQSQLSFASSVPASQLESQTQGGDEDEDEDEEDGEGEEDAQLANGAAALSIDAPISSARLDVFRRTLGQLQSTNLFDDDSAHLNELVTAVNRRLGSQHGGAFARDEAIQALKKMDEDNQIM